MSDSTGRDRNGKRPELPPRTGRAKDQPKKNPAARRDWKIPLLWTGVTLAIVALLGVGGYYLLPLLDRLALGSAVDTTWLPPDSDVIIRARVADAWKSPFVNSFGLAGTGAAKELLGLEPQEIRTVTIGAADMLEPGQGGKPGVGLARLAELSSNSAHAITVLRTVRSFDTREMESKLQGVRTVKYKEEALTFMGGMTPGRRVFFFPNSSTVVMGSEADVKAAIDRGSKRPSRSDLDFLDAEQQLLIVLAPRDASYFSSAAFSTTESPLNPFESALKDKAKTVCLGARFGENVDWSLAVNCNSAAAASEATAGLETALHEGQTRFNQFRGSAPPTLAEFVIVLDGALNSATLRTKGNLVEVRGRIPGSIKNVAGQLPQILAASIAGGPLPGVIGQSPGGTAASHHLSLGARGGIGAQPADAGQPDPSASADLGDSGRGSAELCKNQLRRIGRAMYNAAGKINRFPDTAIRDSSGRSLLSWRVALLPELDEQALYGEFRLNEQWDSAHNKALLDRMPAVFACSRSGAPQGSTVYLAAQGPGAMFEGGKGRNLPEVTDGTASTILLVEVDESLAVPWTKPEDYTFDPNLPLKGLLGPHEEGLLILTADGAPHFLTQPLDPVQVAALFTRSGGERVPPGLLK